MTASGVTNSAVARHLSMRPRRAAECALDNEVLALFRGERDRKLIALIRRVLLDEKYGATGDIEAPRGRSSSGLPADVECEWLARRWSVS
jgi:hypothetical protein